MKQILLFISLFISLCCNAQDDLDKKYASDLIKNGESAPDFVIANGDTLTGKSLKSFRGKFVVLDFWASWCPDCRKDIPAMKELYNRYSTKGVVFVGVSFDKDKKAWKKCIRENGMQWIHHSELKPWKETVISNDYRIKWLPTMYLIDQKGNVVLGTVSIEKMRKALELTISRTEDIKNHTDSLIEARCPGGMNGMMKFIKNNLQYPEMAKKMQAEGQARMYFTVNQDGSITDITATDCKITHYNKATIEKYTDEQQKDIYNECVRQLAKEGYRVIKRMKNWKPDNNAKPIRLNFMVKFSGL